MSDILIKNMKMPENCLHCGFSHMASDCLKIWIICKPKDISVADDDAVKDGRPDWCPLIKVATPHGDLIDRDTLLASENQHYEIHSDSFYVETRTIELAPTIIDGEEET